MSGSIICIDLGTTNSCVSIQGSCPNCYSVDGLPGFSVITDENDRQLTPSVVFYTGDGDKLFEVGYEAKNSVGKYPPVMFAKRHMGSDKKFQVADDQTLGPVQVSAEILKYLRTLAENVLEQRVNRAVVTVPAYFGLDQRQCTRQALEDAGFLVDSDRYIIVEPVAAAYMYTAMTGAENLRIMVYDLGGGTYDVTILEKKAGVIKVRAYGGDPALGGYDFDQLLAEHVLGLLHEKKYQLDLDPYSSPQDALIYSKLLLEVEKVKMDLSRDTVAYLRKPGVFDDQAGKSVELNLTISRKTFEGLIDSLTDRTIELAQETLHKANLKAEELDEIIMVGGSSYIPQVQRKVEAAFCRKPRLVEPDLAVSLGAAVYAASALGNVATGKVRLTLEKLPLRTNLAELDIEGSVSDLEGKPLPGYGVEVTNPAGTLKLGEKVNDSGTFLAMVPLQPNMENRFLVTVFTPDGEEVVSNEVTVVHTDNLDEGVEDIITNPVSLPKALYVKTARGMVILAKEGAPLPFGDMQAFELQIKDTGSQDGPKQLDVCFYEEGREIGVIKVRDIPASVTAGSIVEVSFKISRDNCVHASAYIPSCEEETAITIEPRILPVRSSQELRKELQRLRYEWENLQKVLSADVLADHGVAINRDFARAEEFLKVTAPDTTELSNIVERLQNKLNLIEPVQMEPSMQAFQELCRRAWDIIKKAEAKSDEARDMDYGGTLQSLMHEAEGAYEHRDQGAWQACQQRVQDIADQAKRYLKGANGNGPKPNPLQALLELQVLVRDLPRRAQFSTRSDRDSMLADLDRAKQELAEISRIKDPDEMWNRLVVLYQSTLDPIIAKLNSEAGAGKTPGVLELGASRPS